MGGNLARELRKQTLDNFHDGDPDRSEIPDVLAVRHRPESLDKLVGQTKFTRKEVQMMYRGFKQGCPSGIVNLAQFKDIYAQFFPNGDARLYAEFVFNTFDLDQNGMISFDELVRGLSVLSRGSVEEKLTWVFALYDIDRDGRLSRHEVETVMGSIYQLMGRSVNPPLSEDCVRLHADFVFEKLDRQGTGMITIENFMDACKKDATIFQSMGSFDTIL